MPDEIHLIQDISNITRTARKKGEIVSAALDLAEYFVLPKFAVDSGKRVSVGGGTFTEWLVKVIVGQTAAHVAHDTPDTATTVNTTVKGNLKWRKLTSNWTWDLEERSVNTGTDTEMYDYVALQRLSMEEALVEEMELAFTQKPENSNDVTSPAGLPFWNVKNATEGFTGGNPSGFSNGPGDINSTTYPRTKNYSATYQNIEPDDLLFTLRKAFRKTRFISPTPVSGVIGMSLNRDILTNDDVILELEELLRLQNENLGVDLVRYMNQVVLNGFSVTAMPQLNDDDEDPLYLVSWDALKFMIHGEWWMKESPPLVMPGFHNRFTTFSDTRYNIVNKNRRAGGVIYRP